MLIATYAATGLKGYIVSNTRQTREAAYRYLLETTNLNTFVQRGQAAA